MLSRVPYQIVVTTGVGLGLLALAFSYNKKKCIWKNKSFQIENMKKNQSSNSLKKNNQENHHQGDNSYDLKKRFYRICLTGGPCAGKTVGLGFLCEKLRERNNSVFIVPEAATIIGTGGGMLNLGSYSEQDIIQFQINLLKLQMSLEQTFWEISQLNNGNTKKKRTILLCDRGLMDGKAYMSDELWKKMIKASGLNEDEIRDRYDAVIHMVTAADGAEKYYCLSNNEARHEPIKEAITLDRKSQNAWSQHKQHKIIDNKSVKNFKEKLEKLYNEVNQILGIPTVGKSVKYLLDTGNSLYVEIPSDIQLKKVQKVEIEDIFLEVKRTSEFSKSYQKLQKRINDSKLTYYWTQNVREKGLKVRTMRRQIDHTEFIMLLEHRDKARAPVCKLRSCFSIQDVFMRIDTYPYIAEGFSLLKVDKINLIYLKKIKYHEIDEFEFQIPEFLKNIRDVTAEAGYVTRNMAKRSWYAPRGDEQITHTRKLSNLSDT